MNHTKYLGHGIVTVEELIFSTMNCINKVKLPDICSGFIMWCIICVVVYHYIMANFQIFLCFNIICIAVVVGSVLDQVQEA